MTSRRRDRFIQAAMTGLLSSGCYNSCKPEKLAEMAVQYADAGMRLADATDTPLEAVEQNYDFDLDTGLRLKAVPTNGGNNVGAPQPVKLNAADRRPLRSDY